MVIELSVAKDRYTDVTHIVRGGFSDIFEATRKTDGKIVVIKETNLKGEAYHSESSADEFRDRAREEYELVSQADHPNVVKSFDFYSIDHYAHFIMEHCDAGALKSVISSRLKGKNESTVGFFPEDKIWKWAAQIVRAVQYLHRQLKILHRDIKAENVFLTHGGQVVKLGDFGISKQVTTMRQSVKYTSGTPHFVPPETMAPFFLNYNRKSEVWSIGILLHELISLRLPFAGSSYTEIMRAIARDNPPPLSDEFSNDLRQLVERMLKKDPDARLDVDEIWEHMRIIMALAELSFQVPGLRINLADELQRPTKAGQDQTVIRELGELRDQNETLRRDMGEVQNQNRALTQELSELEELRDQNETLKREMGEVQDQNRALTQGLSELEELRDQKETLKREKKRLCNHNEILMRAFGKVTDDATRKMSEMEGLCDENKRLVCVMTKVRNQNRTLTRKLGEMEGLPEKYETLMHKKDEVREKNKTLRQKLKAKDGALAQSQKMMGEVQSELQAANAELAETTKTLADKKSELSRLTKKSSRTTVQPKPPGPAQTPNAEDYFTKFQKTPQTFYHGELSDIKAILPIPVSHLQTRTASSSGTALAIVCKKGQVIALAPPTLSKEVWRNNVRLPSPLNGDPNFRHAVYDSEGSAFFINHRVSFNSNVVLTLACSRFATPKLAIDRVPLQERVIYGLAVASQQRKLFLCSADGSKKDISVWNLPRDTGQRVELVATIETNITPWFCALSWKGTTLVIAISDWLNGTVELHRADDARQTTGGISAHLRKLATIATEVGKPCEMAFDRGGNLFVADDKNQRVVAFSSNNVKQPAWISNRVGPGCRRLALAADDNLVTHTIADGRQSLAAFI